MNRDGGRYQGTKKKSNKIRDEGEEEGKTGGEEHTCN